MLYGDKTSLFSVYCRRVQSWHVVGITRIILTKDMTSDLWFEGPDLFVLFEEINNIIQCTSHTFTLPETVIGFCQYR